MTGKGDNRSFTARDVIGSVVTTGDHNTITATIKVTLPPASSVDIAAELAALKSALAAVGAPDQAKLDRALADAQDEAKKPEPDRDEIGGALERAIRYAKGAAAFSNHLAKLQPHVTALAGWLGERGHKLLGMVGLSL